MTNLTADTARALPGADWLRARRAEAAERVAATSLPTTDEEVWRYSRIADLDLDAYRVDVDAPADASGQPLAAALEAALATIPDRAATVHVVNGRLADIVVRDPAVTVAEPSEGDLGAVIGEPPDVFTVMNDAFGAAPVVVTVRPGATLDAPIVVAHWTDAAGTAVFPRLVVRLGPDSRACVLDVHTSARDAPILTVPVVELAVERDATLGYVNVQRLGDATWQVASAVSTVDAGGTLRSAVAGLGGDYARQRTDCRLIGRGATGELLAVYFGEREQTLDFRTFQDHVAPDTTSDLLFKGAVGGHSRSVYTGLIHVGKEARGTNAFQTNRNIKLSDGAWAESVPNLEIENNDVRCSHASAVGPVDADQRFYLESRGVPPAVAERLVVMGFFDDVLARLPVAGAVPALRAEIAAKLARRDGQ